MPRPDETSLRGWTTLAHHLGCSVAKAKRYREELLDAGVIFYMYQGRPPRKQLHFWLSQLIRWTALKGNKRETL